MFTYEHFYHISHTFIIINFYDHCMVPEFIYLVGELLGALTAMS